MALKHFLRPRVLLFSLTGQMHLRALKRRQCATAFLLKLPVIYDFSAKPPCIRAC